MLTTSIFEGRSQADTDFAAARREMVEVVAHAFRDSELELGRSSLQASVQRALSTVPRHEFVAARLQEYAYENRPLPIGHGQTISQPYIVATMTDLLDVPPGASVLEIGTGSGYQAAVLAAMDVNVYSVEIIDELAASARTRLRRLGYHSVSVRQGDGYYGWEEHAPYDAIVVTAAASHVPPPLIGQLKPGGRMVIPVGSAFSVQQLVLIEKGEDDEVTTRQLLPVRFVPLTGDH